MRTLLSVVAVLVISGAIAATAAASRTYVVGTRYVGGVGTTGSFKGTVKKPYKIILYCEGVNARCATNVVCVRGTTEFTQSRSGLKPGTWNLKKPSWRRKVMIRSGAKNARATVQATVRT